MTSVRHAVQRLRGADERDALIEQLRETMIGTAAALANTLEARDDYTGGHAREIAELAVSLGRRLGVADDELDELRFGAIFHDIGKIAVPDEILRKPEPLTPNERALMERHTVVGAEILEPIPTLGSVRALVRHSHERWDGTGYPDGLAGESIPLGSRVIAVVDAWHAMVTDRPYRDALPDEAAELELRANSGSQFDPVVVDAFLDGARPHGSRLTARAPVRRPVRIALAADRHRPAAARAAAPLGPVDRTRPPAPLERDPHDLLALGEHHARPRPASSSSDAPPRADPGVEEGAVADRVADPGDDRLVEQRLADLRARRPPRAAGGPRPRGRSPAASGSGPSRARRGSLRSRDSETIRRIWPPVCAATPRPGGEHQPGLAERRRAVGCDPPAAVHAEVAVDGAGRRRSGRAGACRAPRRARARAPGASPARRVNRRARVRRVGQARSRGRRAPSRAAGRCGGSCRPRHRYADATSRRGWRLKPASISASS